MRVTGLLLVAALMVLPVGAAQHVAGSFRSTLLISVAIGAAAVVVGLIIARAAGLPPGGTIVLVAAGAFLASALAGRWRGGAGPLDPA
jgi:zinc transport system permease protein